MKCLVTGAAGFIGSHLVDELLRMGHEVVGIDAFHPYYSKAKKQANQQEALASPRYQFHECDLCQSVPVGLLRDTEILFHLAALPGLPAGWGELADYWKCNVEATANLLHAIRDNNVSLRRLIVASTSSVYGRFASGDESLPTQPISPYGITKLAAEKLCLAFCSDYGLPVVILRYFSVYGPRQRPDMGYFKFIQALQSRQPIPVCGDGRQVRGNTFVADCVRATIAAIAAPAAEVYNVGGDEGASVWDVIHMLEAIAGYPAATLALPPRPGDQRVTLADCGKLRRHLGWTPQVGLDQGLIKQWRWQECLSSPSRHTDG